MARLPVPGADKGTWGEILNDYLSQAHAADGTLKANSVGASQLEAGSITATSIHSGSITAVELDSTTTTSLAKADASVQSINGAIPSNGIVTLAATSIGAEPAGLSNATKGVLSAEYVATTNVPTVVATQASALSLLPVGAFAYETSVIVLGAVPDYTGRLTVAGTGTDNRAAIQAALDAASQPDGGGRYGSYWYSYLQRRSTTVKLPPGHYYISAPSNGAPSLQVPESVTFDTTDAVLYFQYPQTSVTTWAAIQVYKAGSVRVGTIAPIAGTSPADTKLLYDRIRVVASDNFQTWITGQKDSEIANFQGASIRLIGAWITHISNIRFTSDWGLILSSLTSTNIYGISIPSDMASGTARGMTDLFVTECYFGTRCGGIIGPITGDGVGDGATGIGGVNLDYATGALQLYLTRVGFEHFNALPIQVTGYCVSMIDCFWEEVSSNIAIAGWFDSVRSIYIQNFRWNHTGVSVPGPSGNGVSSPPYLFRVNGCRSFIIDGGYAHNTYESNLALAKSNTGAFPDSYEVQGIFCDSRDFGTDIVYGGTKNHSMSALWNLGHLVLGGNHIWVSSTGELRIKSSAPTSDTDGTAVGAQT